MFNGFLRCLEWSTVQVDGYLLGTVSNSNHYTTLGTPYQQFALDSFSQCQDKISE